MQSNVNLIIVCAIIAFATFLSSLCVIFWYMKRQASQQRPAGKNSGEQKTGDELDESQAAEITATWTNLNPP